MTKLFQEGLLWLGDLSVEGSLERGLERSQGVNGFLHSHQKGLPNFLMSQKGRNCVLGVQDFSLEQVMVDVKIDYNGR
ncbi:hypothetical protein Pyn_38786 [Prunus yedoensis var. nudiflora]|uniref:Uncharacterized protein n=1 Tax=Prunus yedoensis var. nudiflora TaxID=2094558 RepID=A0A314YNV1_PRUYE|nr:hypothetical protein Pyn_38786 [Prunus yedoensis var. nudiflora]